MLPHMSDDGQGNGQDPNPPAPAGGSDLERLRNELKVARESAKNWRVKHDELERQLAEAQRAQGGSQTELERLSGQIKTLTEQVQAEQQGRQQAQLQALRVQVAAAKGLPAKLASRLQGTTQEELEADADDILTTLPQQGAGGGGTGEGAGNGQQPPPPRPSNAGQHAQGPAPAARSENDYFRSLWGQKK